MKQFVGILHHDSHLYNFSGIVSYIDNACLKFELMGCEEPKVEPLLGYDYGYSPCVGMYHNHSLILILFLLCYNVFIY